MAIKAGEYLLIDHRALNGMFEKKETTQTAGYIMLEKLAKKFGSPFVLVKVLAIASPALSSPDASHSPAQEGDAHPAPLEGPTNKAE